MSNYEHPIRKKLINELYFNPFNQAFDIERIFKEIKFFYEKNEIDPYAKKFLSTCASLTLMNKIYEGGYNSIKKNLEKINVSKNNVFNYLIAWANCNNLIRTEEMHEKLKNNKNLYFESIYGAQIESNESSFGKQNLISLVETAVDSLHIISNYIKDSYSLKEPENINEKEILINTINLLRNSNYLYVIKDVYEYCIWNKGFMLLDMEKKEIHVEFDDLDSLILKQIGFIRFERNMMQSYMIGIQEKSRNKKLYFGLILNYYKNKHDKKIDKVYVDDGYINYSLTSGIDEEELDLIIKNISELSTYYDFILDIKFDNFILQDFIEMFSLIQYLISKTPSSSVKKIFNRKDLFSFAFRIKLKNLKNYLKERTIFDEKQINLFIKLLINDESEKINFWNYPFLKINQDILFPTLTINSPILVHLIDVWLEKCGVNLTIRGKYLENYIKKDVSETLNKKGFEYNIPITKKFKSKSKKYEEVDFILNLKHILIIGEIKCIKFPIDSRDYYNSYKALERGVKQVNRKADFIKKNSKDFENEIGGIENKKMVKIVITNFPMFTGYVIEDVPIIDFASLHMYISSGKIIHNAKLIGHNIDTELAEHVYFYNNEDEFSINFSEYLIKNPAIEKLKSMCKIEKHIIPVGNDFSIFVTSCVCKETAFPLTPPSSSVT